ncbi:MAG: glycosyltransferase family 87 protein [Candidatus Kryptoniota bacterium]
MFTSGIFILLYGILPGFLSLEGNFVAYQTAGKFIRSGGNPSALYKFGKLQQQIDRAGFNTSDRSFVTSTPAELIVDAVISIPPIRFAKFLVTLINLLAVFLMVHMVASISKAPLTLAYLVFISSSYVMAANFRWCEPYLVLGMIYVLTFYSISVNANKIAGISLGLIFPLKFFSVIPAVFFLLTKNWKAVIYFIVTAFLISLITFMVIGESTFVHYLQNILPFYLDGLIGNPFSVSNQSAWSFFKHLFVYDQSFNRVPFYSSIPAYSLAISFFKSLTVVVPAYFFHRAAEHKSAREAMIAASFPIILLSPVSTTYQIILLAPAIVALAQTEFERNNTWLSRIYILIYAIASIPFYVIVERYFKTTNPFLLYERFLLIFLLFLIYMVAEFRMVSKSTILARISTISILTAALTASLYLGSTKSNYDIPQNYLPALSSSEMLYPSIDPVPLPGNPVAYIKYDSNTNRFLPESFPKLLSDTVNYYSISSSDSKKSMAISTAIQNRMLVYFATNREKASFTGENAEVSSDGKWGTFVNNGQAYIVSLLPTDIDIVDSISVLPFRIIECKFDQSDNYHIYFSVDSLQEEKSVYSYSLLYRSFSPVLVNKKFITFCVERGLIFYTQTDADSTTVSVYLNKKESKLFSLRGNIMNLSIFNQWLYFASDANRGLWLPTIYKFPLSTIR